MNVGVMLYDTQDSRFTPRDYPFGATCYEAIFSKEEFDTFVQEEELTIEPDTTHTEFAPANPKRLLKNGKRVGCCMETSRTELP